MSNSLKIKGAVLETSNASLPYAKSQPLTISELDLSAPGKNEVLVKITAAGLCHSDLSVVNNNRPRPLPMLLGHESAGIVEEVGPNVSKVKKGDHVVMTFYLVAESAMVVKPTEKYLARSGPPLMQKELSFVVLDT